MFGADEEVARRGAPAVENELREHRQMQVDVGARVRAPRRQVRAGGRLAWRVRDRGVWLMDQEQLAREK